MRYLTLVTCVVALTCVVRDTCVVSDYYHLRGGTHLRGERYLRGICMTTCVVKDTCVVSDQPAGWTGRIAVLLLLSSFPVCLHSRAMLTLIGISFCLHVHCFFILLFNFELSSLLAGRCMARSKEEESSSYEDVSADEAPATGTSPFDAPAHPPRVEREKKSRSRDRGRRRHRRHHRGTRRSHERRRGRGSEESGRRAEERDSHRREHHDRRSVASVPEPANPPKHSSKGQDAVKKNYKGNRGPKGGKGRGKTEPWVCTYCGQKTAPHNAALEQHQYLNEWCIANQIWSKMSKEEKEQNWSWHEAKQKARCKKYQRQSEAVEDGWELPEEEEREERGRSAAVSLRSKAEVPASSKKEPQPVPDAGELEEEPDKKVKKKKKKDDRESSPSDESDRKGRKKRRHVVINIR